MPAVRPTVVSMWAILLLLCHLQGVASAPPDQQIQGIQATRTNKFPSRKALDDTFKFFGNMGQSAIVFGLAGIAFGVAQARFTKIDAAVATKSKQVFQATTPGGVCVHNNQEPGAWHYCDEPGFACYNSKGVRKFSHMMGLNCSAGYVASNLAVREALGVMVNCSCLGKHTTVMTDIGDVTSWLETSLTVVREWTDTYLISCGFGAAGARVFSSQADLTDERSLTRKQIDTGVIRLEATSKLSHLWIQLAMTNAGCTPECVSKQISASMGLHPSAFEEILECGGSTNVWTAEYCRPYACTTLPGALVVDTEQFSTYGSILAAASDSTKIYFGGANKTYNEMFAAYTGLYTAMVMAAFQGLGHLVLFFVAWWWDYFDDVNNVVSHIVWAAWAGIWGPLHGVTVTE